VVFGAIILELYDFVSSNLGDNLIETSELYHYLHSLDKAGQIIKIREDRKLKAVCCYFFCEKKDLAIVETFDNWKLPDEYRKGDAIYASLIVSKGEVWTRKLLAELREIFKEQDAERLVGIGFDQPVRVWIIDKIEDKLQYKVVKLEGVYNEN